MSKIGKKIIPIPLGVSVVLDNANIIVSGPKGTLILPLHHTLTLTIHQGRCSLSFIGTDLESTAIWGTTRSLLKNAIIGVSSGYTKTLLILGVGYTARLEGSHLVLSLGFSHPVHFPIPQFITIDVEKDSKGNPLLTVSGLDKCLVGKVSADIRNLKRPEPYKGKGIRYLGEVVKMKAGKSSKK
ncbi:MAG: 50S ribosomal protein L6 [Candidatus Absconditabacterales bacterium]|nr:50S ribosomal protein L6 [Candidatus Absconditabacterales bacterium]